MEDRTSSRHGQMLIALLTLCAIALILVSGWYYWHQRIATETLVSQGLRAVAEIKAKQIANWRRERLGDGRAFESLPILRLARRVLSRPDMKAADRADLLDAMERLERGFLYTAAALVDRNGTIRLQSDLAPSNPARIAELGKAATEAADVGLQDLYWDTKLRRPLMALSVPVHGLGAFIFTIDPHRFLYPFLELWPVLSATAETDLVRRDGNRTLCLSDLRSRPGSAFHAWLPVRLPDTPMNSGKTSKATDYRGVTVERTVVPIPDSPWYLIAKIDTSEVDAPVARFGWEMALIIALIALAHAAGTAFIWRDQQMHIHRERERLLQRVAYDSPAYLWMTSAEGENVFINRTFAEFLGTNRQSLGKEWLPYLHPDDAEQIFEEFSRCMKAHIEYVGEQRVRRFDGEYRYLISTGRPRFSDDGEYLGHSGSLFDITERKQAEQQLQAANAALAEELKERAERENEIRSLSARLINAQEEERSRLARELHDDLSQQIAALSIAVSNLKTGVPLEFAEVRSQSERIRERLAQLGEGVRRLSHELHPAILQYSGLNAALRVYCSEFAALAGIRIAFHSNGSFAGMPPATALCAYRITQEALQNVVKHAHTQEAEIALTRSGNTVKLTISDNGVGMDLNVARTARGLGLTSMTERARLVNGTVDIQSAPGRGTTLTVTLPVEPEFVVPSLNAK